MCFEAFIALHVCERSRTGKNGILADICTDAIALLGLQHALWIKIMILNNHLVIYFDIGYSWQSATLTKITKCQLMKKLWWKN